MGRWTNYARSIVYVKNLEDGNQALVIYDGANERTIFRGASFARISRPAWNGSPLKDWIAFSLKENNVSEKILAIHAQTGETKVLLAEDSAQQNISNTSPAWSNSGSLVYASSRGGVFNVYQLDSSEIAHFLQAQSAGVSSHKSPNSKRAHSRRWSQGGKLYASVYHGSGFDIAEIPPSRRSDSEPA